MNSDSTQPADSIGSDKTDCYMGVHFSSASIYWATPQDFFDSANREFGFTLDVCANESNAKCEDFFTEEDNALIKDWGANVCWMNPPYGREIKAFMAKAHSASLSGATVVCLVPSRTDTEWWHKYAMKHEIRFLKGRLKFGDAKDAAPFPSALIVMRPDKFSLSSM